MIYMVIKREILPGKELPKVFRLSKETGSQVYKETAL